jgi:hypothetical protein
VKISVSRFRSSSSSSSTLVKAEAT